MAGEIFISYRRADRDKADLLHRLLKERGVDAWYDALLDAGDDWRTKTANALVSAPIFVLMFSRAAAESDDISKELAAATFQKKVVIPVRLEDIRPEGAFLYELAARNWFDAFGTDADMRMAVLADRLAAVVKGGPKAEAAARNLGATTLSIGQAPKRRMSPYALGGMAIGALAIVFGGLTALNPPNKPDVSVAGSSRIAFFGITAAGDDAAGVAAAATDRTFQYLGARRIEVAARAETHGADAASRLARAKNLGSRYALSGEARRDGDDVLVALRLEDVQTRATLWEHVTEGPSARPRAVAIAAARDAAQVSTCFATGIYGGLNDRTSASLDGLVKTVCLAVSRPERMRAYRDLLQQDPENGRLQAVLALNIIEVMLGSGHDDQLEVEAEKALAEAHRLAPDAYTTTTAEAMMAIWRHEPPAQWLVKLEKDLKRQPLPAELIYYARSANIASLSLLHAGRISEAARYAEIALEADPLYPPYLELSGFLKAALGGFGSETSVQSQLADSMENTTWEVAMASALFLGRGADPDELLKPELAAQATPKAVKCYRDLRTALNSAARASRLAGARSAHACLDQLDTPQIAIWADAALGDLDSAFALAEDPNVTQGNLLVGYSPLFLTPLKAFRADLRFVTLMSNQGWYEYWRTSGTMPDVCVQGSEIEAEFCKALAE